MTELLLNSSADPSALDMNRLNETMSKVLKRELSVLDSSDNENYDDESTSALSPLTSENDYEHDDDKIDDEQNLHGESNETNDKNLSIHTNCTDAQRNKVNKTMLSYGFIDRCVFLFIDAPSFSWTFVAFIGFIVAK
jgi:hypothetical protein